MTRTLIVRGVPDDLHKRFKVWCARNDISMNRMIIAYMEDELKKAKGKRKVVEPSPIKDEEESPPNRMIGDSDEASAWIDSMKQSSQQSEQEDQS